MGRTVQARLRLAAASLVVGAVLSLALPRHADGFTGTTRSRRPGPDSCVVPSTSQMSAWWTYSPYYNWGVYMGGSRLGNGCTTPTQSWMNDVIPPWRMELLWVGPQSTCFGGSPVISNNLSTAHSQGYSEAQVAGYVAALLGFSTGTTVYYDLEGYSQGDLNACREAAKSFMSGWGQLFNAISWAPGVYGSSCASYLSDFKTISYAPVIVGADWDFDAYVYNMDCVDPSAWVGARGKQFLYGHNETQGGVTLFVDSNCWDGSVSPSGGDGGANDACV